MHLWGHAISLLLYPIVHCPRSKNQDVYQQVGKRHVDEDREEGATCRVTSVAGLSGRWSEQRLLRSPSHSDYSEAEEPGCGPCCLRPASHIRHYSWEATEAQKVTLRHKHKQQTQTTNTNRNTNNKVTMMLKKQNTSTAWRTWNNLWRPWGTSRHKILLQFRILASSS